MLTQHELSVERTRISYYCAGEQGPPTVLLHGGGVDNARLSWKETVPALAPHYRLYLPDWPGYGASEALSGVSSTRALIHVLDKLLAAWELPQVNLVGVSMGGAVALGFALKQPSRVRQMVLVDSYGLQDKAPAHLLSALTVRLPGAIGGTWAALRRSRWLTRLALASIFADKAAVDEALVDEVFEAVQAPGMGQTFLSWQRDEVRWQGLRTCYMDRLDTLTVATLLIHGAQDTLVPLRFAREAAARMPDVRLAVLQGAGHWPQREQPERFNDALLSFLKR